MRSRTSATCTSRTASSRCRRTTTWGSTSAPASSSRSRATSGSSIEPGAIRPVSTIRVLADRRHLCAFIAGCVAVTAGVLLHLPMYWMGREMGFHLADMPMDDGMLWGMALIVAGLGVAGYGLLPRKLGAGHAPVEPKVVVSAPEDA